MSRKRNKGSQNRQNAAGDSRVSVLTEENDTYNPFKEINKLDSVVKIKESKKINKNIKKREEIVEKLDQDVSFKDIFEQWEKGGIVDNFNANKKNKKIKHEEKEDFANIFEQWEISQGIKPKKTLKKKDLQDLNRKVSEYNPTKDFGQLLEQFETGIPPKKKANIKNNNNKSKESVASNKKTSNNLIEESVIKTVEFDNKLNISDNEIKVVEVVSEEVVAEKKVAEVVSEEIVVEKKVAWSSSKSQVNKKSLSEANIQEKNNLNFDDKNAKNKESKNKGNYIKGDFKKNKPYNVDKKIIVDSKWDFSSIYDNWQTQHDEAALIESAKAKDKKENKGISISYLRSMKPEAEIDLHGLTSDIAALKVSEFLTNSRNKGLKKVSIITGKGNHSENGLAVLRDVALEEIRFSNIVREAYHPKAIYGGSGVIWVIFKSITDKKIYF